MTPADPSRPYLPLAVIVGAGGMGTAIARRLGQHYRLLLADLQQARLDTVTGLLREEGYEVQPCQCDITNAAAVQHLTHIAKTQGPVRVLAHVAALSPSMGDWQTLIQVNLMGAHRIEQAFLNIATPGMVAIFISSLAAHIASVNTSVTSLLDQPMTPDLLTKLAAAVAEPLNSNTAYTWSKFAMNRRCQRQAAAWGAQGARIVSVSPGLIATPMGALEFKNQPQKFVLLDKTPLHRQGSVQEIADAVEFLASDRASFITGTDLRVDGGVAAALQHAS